VVESELGSFYCSTKALGCKDFDVHMLEFVEGTKSEGFRSKMSSAAPGGSIDQGRS